MYTEEKDRVTHSANIWLNFAKTNALLRIVTFVLFLVFMKNSKKSKKLRRNKNG